MVWFSDAQSVPERTPCASFFSLVEKQMGTQIVKLLLPHQPRAAWRLARRPRPRWRKKRTTRGELDFNPSEVTWQISEDTFPQAFPSLRGLREANSGPGTSLPQWSKQQYCSTGRTGGSRERGCGQTITRQPFF